MSTNKKLVLRIVLLDCFYSESFSLLKTGKSYYLRVLITRIRCKNININDNNKNNCNTNKEKLIFVTKEIILENKPINLSDEEILM